MNIANKFFSWYIMDSDLAIKKLDKSFYKSGITGIPVDVRSFFNIENKLFNRKKINLWYENRSYPVVLESYGKSKVRARLRTQKFFTENKKDIFSNEFIIFRFIDNENYLITLCSKLDKDSELSDPLETNAIMDTSEGKRIIYFTTRYERKKKNREEAIRIHGLKCQICGFDFEKKYGVLGNGFIEVHHIKALFNLDDEIEVNPETDLICVCCNCHRMLHRNRKIVMVPNELIKIIKEQELKI